MRKKMALENIEGMKAKTFKGQPFIGEKVNYGGREGIWERECKVCFYRYGQGDMYKSNQDWTILPAEGKHPKELFGYVGKFLPEKIDGKEIGNYCPYFLPFTAE